MTCPESGRRYRDVQPGVVRGLDVDDEASLPEEIESGREAVPGIPTKEELLRGRGAFGRLRAEAWQLTP